MTLSTRGVDDALEYILLGTRLDSPRVLKLFNFVFRGPRWDHNRTIATAGNAETLLIVAGCCCAT
jgi:hypothetical protein